MENQARVVPACCQNKARGNFRAPLSFASEMLITTAGERYHRLGAASFWAHSEKTSAERLAVIFDLGFEGSGF
jgi:hypothetical protein